MESQSTAQSAPPAKFTSIRTILITRFVILITLMTLGIALAFYLFIAPAVMNSVRGYLTDAMREADVSEEQINTILTENQQFYFSDVRANIRRNVMGAVGVFFLVGLASIYGITTVGTRWLNDLTSASRAIARGEYAQDLSHLYNMLIQSEITELARAIEESGRVHIREQVLIQKVQELEIRIDEKKKQEQVGEIVESEFFQDLTAKAKALRSARSTPPKND